MKSPNITYAKMSATPDSVEELERIVGPEGSVDLVTVAAALHWFDRDKFYPIVKRMLRKPGGVIAAFSYSRETIKICPEFEEALERYYQTLLPFLSGVRYPLNEMQFPFDPVPGVEPGKGVPGSPLLIPIELPWSFDDFLVFLRTFSSYQTALDRGVDLLNEDARRDLAKAWGPESVRTVSLTTSALLGTVNSATSDD